MFDGFHKFTGNQQREVELAQATVFTFGADEIQHIRMTDIKGRHLRTSTATG